ncbi:MAG TPA: alpha/beta hydrolase [Solirubrobacterales bacterium]|nr:alpha/beta hydrolase [Solirubrobacterales bacterium]
MFEPGGATEIDGRRLSWRSVGTGPPLLLVNGYAATAADWDPAALSALAESFEVVCPDNRGVGGSQLGDPAELTIDSMAADLEALLDALEIERAPVAGWSMGGFAVQRLAVRAPHRIERWRCSRPTPAAARRSRPTPRSGPGSSTTPAPRESRRAG